MNLYFHPLSGNSRRALLVAEHLKVPVERVLVNLQTGEQKLPPHLSRNPNGRVPVLEDNGFVLWESRAIMQYLCDITPGQTLMPTDAKARADVNRWLFWDAMHMSTPNAILVVENVVKGFRGEAPDPAEVAKGNALFAQYAAILDEHLAGRTWVSGDTLTLADYSLAAGFQAAQPAKFPIAPFANILAWRERVAGLDAWKTTAPPIPPPR